LTSTGQIDASLGEQVGAAATVAGDGGRGLDDVVAHTHAIAHKRDGAHLGGQTGSSAGLRIQLRQANSVANAIRRLATDIAEQICALNYGSGGTV
jgi:hypothetical protein